MISLDLLITAVARVLAGGPLAALKLGAPRDDLPAFALCRIAMARLGGLTRANDLLCCACLQIDPETGAVLRTVESDRFVTGVTWGRRRTLARHIDWRREDLRRVDPETGAVLERLDMRSDVGVPGPESDGADHYSNRALASRGLAQPRQCESQVVS